MFSSYVDFTINVGPPNAGGYSVTVHSPGGDARGLLTLPDGEPFKIITTKLQNLEADEATLTSRGPAPICRRGKASSLMRPDQLSRRSRCVSRA
jgi:hypothetical protein